MRERAHVGALRDQATWRRGAGKEPDVELHSPKGEVSDRIRARAGACVAAVLLADFDAAIDVGAVDRWMEPGDISDGAVRLAPMHDRVVEITGLFRAKRHGHMGADGGEIVVTKYAILGKHDRGDVPPEDQAAISVLTPMRSSEVRLNSEG